ncbi:MAG: hypothetical protein VKM34_03955 [Cyanobacteriota bacterium]|nr:hypothetical protein [Cyanobacteriota bacterium]
MLRQLLLLPLLAPLLAVMLVGALNPRPLVRLRLLTWSSPALPIGVWMLLAAGGGGLLSAGSTSLALRAERGPGNPRPRQVRRPLWEREPQAQPPQDPTWSSPPPPSAGPSRPPGEPAPTVAVPFRVIRRGDRASASTTARVATTQASPTWARTAPSSDQPAGDWDQPVDDDW